MNRPSEQGASQPVEPIVVSEIRDLVEPVRCRGGDVTDHDPVEAECVETGVGYVTYECPDCGFRMTYYHASGEADPCCAPRG
ncbi:MAG: hypothetical protein ABEI31_04595 [Halodesulfurarchaeum sp.]